MLKVGLTGGYATGKSFVAAELERLGCHLIYADQLGHRVLLPDEGAYAPTVQAFGPEILAADGSIDRQKLGAIVFGSPELLAQLSGFVHPAVFRMEEKLLAAFAASDPCGIAVIEAAILIETGRYKGFDRLILTACDVEVQIARAMKRDGLTREQVLARLENQMPVEEKRKYAHYVVDTGGTKEETMRQVEHVYRELKELAETKES
jgi:dephospho-CoA kinase